MSNVNLIFLGGFDFPHGMAGTKRIQNLIKGLKVFKNVKIYVIVLRQASSINILSGTYQNIQYQTIMGDIFRLKALLLAPILYLKARKLLTELFKPNMNNIIYVYGPPTYDNFLILRYAKKMGYKLIFDIVEDYDFSEGISDNLAHKIRIKIVKTFLYRISSLASGVIVISSYLEKKYFKRTQGKIPIHKMTISVNTDDYLSESQVFGYPIKLFYSGSFGQKDGLPILLDAFESLVSRRTDIRLILTGIGSAEDMNKLFNRIDSSPFKNKIVYKGYLDDSEYIKELNSADILCIPRINTNYAHAGFPFKLGEYMASGKPVIVTTVSDIPQLLINEQDAILITPGNISDLANAVEMLIDNPDNAFKIANKGRLLAQQLFDYRSQSEKFYYFLNNFIE